MWYYAKNGVQEGPVPLEYLQGLLRTHMLPLTTNVWREGMEQWQPANHLPEVMTAVIENHVSQPAPGLAMGMGSPVTNGMAITSMVLGLSGLLILPVILSIPAVICGHLARSQIRNAEGRESGDGMAIAGLITGYLGISIGLVVIAFIVLAIYMAV